MGPGMRSSMRLKRVSVHSSVRDDCYRQMMLASGYRLQDKRTGLELYGGFESL